MKIGRVFGISLVVSCYASGQTAIDLRTQAKAIDFSGATSTKPSKAGTILPASCSSGETFLKLNAAPGQNFYVCTSTNTWTPQASASLGFTPLNASNNLSDLSNAAQARTNLGLGTAALMVTEGTGTAVPTMFGTFAANAVLIRNADGNVVDSGCTISIGAGIGCPGNGQITVKESSLPSAPAPGYQTLFFDSADHNLKLATSSASINQIATTSGQETLSSKTFIQPTIGDFSNAVHSHTTAASGGQIAEAALNLTDITAGNATTTKHGLLPKLSGSPTDVLKGDGTFGPGGGGPGSGLGAFYTFNFKLTGPSTASIIPNYPAATETGGNNGYLYTAAVPADCSFQNLYLAIQSGAAVAAGKSVVATLYTNTLGGNVIDGGTASPVTCTIGAAGNRCSDTVHTGAISSGNAWALKLVSTDPASLFFVGAIQCK